MERPPISAITPNVEQFQELAASTDSGPVVMLNLLKFKQRAEGAEGTGAEAYQRYANAAIEMVERLGGRLVFAGRAEQVLIGDPAVDWDVVAVAQYPSRQAFIGMVTSPDYLEAHAEREAALDRTIVIACAPLTVDGLAE